ncbi:MULTISPECIES: esterase/lipase family protein [Cryobacterium]|uniref:esterase/lipase family protein n=1 Tax=Cryobacterium TaxID=69578 RepID=UPI000CD44947|nr:MULTISPECIES: alpha/beta hydrolase [Cryobacterium]POH63468.1 alpha/beta hydrolase [Cryobacterium zongtaii]TFC42196.1 alpha/beta hydrolase [Cryobacterium sp. TMN-39-2]TFC89746.1 alpha/beta hydrolase [Cryobacterium sp. TMT4-31]
MTRKPGRSARGLLCVGLRNAGSWLLDYRYAVLAQVSGALARTHPDDYASGEAAPVLIIPGIYESWHFMRPLIQALHDAGHPVHVVTPLHTNRRPVVPSAEIVAEYLRDRELNRLVIVAHSKGGLIGKYLMTQLDPDDRVERMVAVSTPFSGSRYARYMPTPSLRAFAGTDPQLAALGADARLNDRIVSVFGRFDPHIPDGSILTGAENVRIDTGGHFRILSHPDTVRQVLAAAARP